MANTIKSGRLRGQVIPYADPRACTDRLNSLFTPAGWTGKNAVHTSDKFEQSRGPEDSRQGIRDAWVDDLRFGFLEADLPDVKQALVRAGYVTLDVLATMPPTITDRAPSTRSQASLKSSSLCIAVSPSRVC